MYQLVFFYYIMFYECTSWICTEFSVENEFEYSIDFQDYTIFYFRNEMAIGEGPVASKSTQILTVLLMKLFLSESHIRCTSRMYFFLLICMNG